MTDFNTLFYRDAYLKEFDATVLTCIEGDDSYIVTLDQTAFYPEGGGQPGDHGTIAEAKVTDVQYDQNAIVHYTDRPLVPGSTVHCVIDWQRRFDLMQNHTGEHIFSGLVHHYFGYENVGFHMGETIQIDFSGPLSKEQVQMIETEANRIICSNVAVEEVYPEEVELEKIDYRSKKELEGTVRLIRIPEADVCACCGTHVKYTGEIGLIKVLSCAKHKKGVRLEILCGKRAFEYVQKICVQNHRISVLLSAEPLQTASAVDRLLKENAEQVRAIGELTMKRLLAKIKELPVDNGLVYDFEEPVDRNVLRRYGNAMLQEKQAETAAVFSGEKDQWSYFVISHTQDLRPLSKALNESLNGRGGGSPEMIQGSVCALPEEIIRVVKKTLNIETEISKNRH